MAANEDESMLICAVRYAHGRRSYVVSEACGWVRNRWPQLSQGTRDVIRNDLKYLLERGERSPSALGMEMDAREWKDLATWMDLQE